MCRKVIYLFFLLSIGTFLALKAQDTSHKSISFPKDSIVENPDQAPEYPGGYSAMEKFIAKNVKYPKEALKQRIGGTVYYSFVVLPDGKLTDITIIKNIEGGCGEASMEVIKKMPPWHPGLLKDKPVAVKVYIPMKFIPR
jgi:protein TonB